MKFIKLNPLYPSVYTVTERFNIQQKNSAFFAHSACAPYDSHNKQQFFPCTALTNWSFQWKHRVFSVKRTES